MKKRLVSLFLSLILCVGVLPLNASAAGFTRSRTYQQGQFTDVAANVWYANSVKDCYELGLMSGNTATTFNPTGMFTIAEASTVAARMHSIYNGGDGTIPAAAGEWYQGAVEYCIANEIYAAGDFDSYTRPATRAEMVGIIAAALPESAWNEKNSVTTLPDVSSGTDYAEAIFRFYNAGVLSGSDEYGLFQPFANITRAEVAAIVARCALPQQRLTLNLTPLSQRQAPELIGGYMSDGINLSGGIGTIMSNGRLRFQDPDTKLYGYMDGYGNVVIPAIYSMAYSFIVPDCAQVTKSNGQNAIIDKNGKELAEAGQLYYYGDTAVEFYRAGYAKVKATNKNQWYGDFGIWSIREQKLILPCQYYQIDMLVVGGNHYILAHGEEKVKVNGTSGQVSYYEVFDSTGKRVIPKKFDNVVWTADYFICRDSYDYVNPENNKERGYTVYDKTGNQVRRLNCTQCRVDGSGTNSLIAIAEGGKWGIETLDGRKLTDTIYDEVTLYPNKNYAQVRYGNTYGLVGLTGVIIEVGTYNYCNLCSDDYIRVSNEGSKTSSLLDVTGQVVSEVMGEREDVVNNIHILDKGFVLAGWGWYGDYWYLRADGKYGYCLNPRDETSYAEAIYNSAEEAMAAKKEAEEEARRRYWEPAPSYAVRTADNGKPYIAYGNDATGWTPVVEYYQNKLYYDEIKPIGEDYFACRYNQTWYLVHP